MASEQLRIGFKAEDQGLLTYIGSLERSFVRLQTTANSFGNKMGTSMKNITQNRPTGLKPSFDVTDAVNESFKKTELVAKNANKGLADHMRGMASAATQPVKDMGDAAAEANSKLRADGKLTANSMAERAKEYATKQKEYERQAKANVDALTKAEKEVQKNIQKTAQASKQGTRKFQGYAMSLMFFGMAVQKIFNSIWKSSTKAFQEVMHSVEGTTTSYDMLTGSIKYLGFVTGEALEPIVARLIPIIDKIAEWVRLHPRLTAGIVKWGTALGAIFMVGGSGILALEGFIGLGQKLGFVKFNADGAIKSIHGFSSFKDMFTKLGTNLKTGLIKNLKWIKANPIKSIVGAAVITGIVTAFLWLNRMQKNMGGWDELFGAVGNGLIKIMAMMSASMTATIAKAKDMWKAIRGKETSGLSYIDIYGEKLEENLETAGFHTPLNGWIEDSRTLAEIWAGDLYPQVEELEIAMGGVANAMKEVAFSSSDIASLLSKDLLSTDSIGAILQADVINQGTVTGDTEKMLNDLYSQGTGDTFFIDRLSVESNADSIESILTALKSRV